MNISEIRKHYDKLTARERFALMIAAGARDDKSAMRALADSAPQVAFRFPHTQGLADAFEHLTLTHVLTQLGHAATFLLLLVAEPDREPTEAESELQNGALRKIRQAFLEGADAWQAICQEYHLDPEALTKGYPFGDVLTFAELVMRADLADDPLELTGLQETIDAYRTFIEREREHWGEARAQA